MRIRCINDCSEKIEKFSENMIKMSIKIGEGAKMSFFIQNEGVELQPDIAKI